VTAFQDMHRAKETRISKIEEAAVQLRSNSINHEQFREAIQLSGVQLGGAYENIFNKPAYADTFREWQESERDLPEDELYRQYQAIRFDAQWELGAEGFNFHGRDAVLQAFREEHGEEVWEAMKENDRLGRANMPPEAQEWFKDSETLSIYWSIKDNLVAKAGLTDKLTIYNRLTGKQQQIFAHASGLNSILESVRKQRELLRYYNPEIDGLLVKWYGRTPIRER
jgi:hypothetical protein